MKKLISIATLCLLFCGIAYAQNSLGTGAGGVLAPSSITGYPTDATKFLNGSGAWTVPGASAASPCTYFVDNSATGCGGGGCVDGNAGTSLATAWLTLAKVHAVTLTAGQTVCLVGEDNPNTTNGGIWREQYIQVGGGSGWGANQVTITSYDQTKPAIVTGASCYGAASGLCTGSTPVTWHQCGSGDVLCGSSVDANITNVWEYTRPTAVHGAIYLDDPDVIYGTTLWSDQTKFLNGASCLPGGACARASNAFQADMTAGTWYDDGTHLYIWLAPAGDPGTHVIEAPTTTIGQGIIRALARDYTEYSYLKVMYVPTSGIEALANSAVTPIHVKMDHNQVGGLGAGPVTNEGSMYAIGLFASGSNAATPAGAVTATEVTFDHNVVNWCGSHNCIGSDGSNGAHTYTNNVVGTSEHNGIDLKCPGSNSIIANNYVHDAWTGTLVGSDSANVYKQNAYYMEPFFAACSGGKVTWQNNTGYKVNVGMFCNMGVALGGAAASATCQMYNNTMVLQPEASVINPCYDLATAVNMTLTGDTENNLCQTPIAGTRGFTWGTGGTDNITEKYNLYYNTTGTNTNGYGGSTFTSLAAWQASCGGGSKCGTGDIWQTDPRLSQISNNQYLLDITSPAITAGTGLVGTSPTMGAVADPLIESSRWGHILIPAVVAGGGNATSTLLTSCTGAGCTDINRLANGANVGTLTITTPASTGLADGQDVFVVVNDTAGNSPTDIPWVAGSGVTLKSGMMGLTAANLVGTTAPDVTARNTVCGTPPATGTAIFKWNWNATSGNLRLLGCTIDPPGTVLSSLLGGLGVAPTQYNVQVGGAAGAAMTQVAPSATSGVPLISQGAAANPAYGTALVAGGGTGLTTLTAHALYAGNTTSAPAAVGPDASTVKALTSAGNSADPAYKYFPARPAFFFGNVTASECVNYPLTGAIAVPTNFTSSTWPDSTAIVACTTAPGASNTFTLYCDAANGTDGSGTAMGTIAFTACTGAGTTLNTTSTSCAAGSTLRLCAPGTVNGETELSITIGGHWTS